MPIGLICTIFTSLLILLIFIFNSRTKKIFSNYWIYSIVSIIFLIYFLLFRWIKDLNDWINNNDNSYVGEIDVVISKVLLLDMCPFGSVILSISLIVDRRRYFASAISYFGIIGGTITIYGQIMFEGVNSTNISWINNINGISAWEYVFLNKAYFLMHFYLLIMSIIVLMNTNGFSLLKIFVAHLYAIIFFTYITIIVFVLNIKWNATGIVENDWLINGEYEVIGSMLNLVWPWPPIVVFTFVWILINFLIFLRNLMILDPNFFKGKILINKKLKNKYLCLFNSNNSIVKIK